MLKWVILFLEDVGEAVRRRRLRVPEDGVLKWVHTDHIRYIRNGYILSDS